MDQLIQNQNAHVMASAKEAIKNYQEKNYREALKILEKLLLDLPESVKTSNSYEPIELIPPDSIVWVPWIELAIVELKKILKEGVVTVDCISVNLCLNTAISSLIQ